MDEKKLRAVKQVLDWEVRYRLRRDGKDTGKFFLPEITSLDSDFSNALLAHDIRPGRLLEIGCGSGTQAVQFARLGFEVTATEISDTAIKQASELALSQGVTVSFVNDNIFYSKLRETFDTVVDRGCFTLLPPDLLNLYVANVSRLSKPDGFLLVKVDKKSSEKLDLLLDAFELLDRVPGSYQRDENETSRTVKSVFAVLKHRQAIPTI